MKIRLPIQLALVLVSSAGMAHGTTILTFDEFNAGVITPPYTPVVPGAGYAGLNWNNFYVVDGADSPTSGIQAGVVSGKNVLITGGDSGGSIFVSNPALTFNLTSGYFTSAWNDDMVLEVKGFIGGSLAFDNTYALSATAATLLAFNYLGVTEVDFSATYSGIHVHPGYNGSGGNIVFDNLGININDPSLSVPETASSALLFGAAMAGLVAYRRRLA